MRYVIFVSFPVMSPQRVAMRRVGGLAVRGQLRRCVGGRVVQRFPLTVVGRVTALYFSVGTHGKVFSFAL